MIIPKVADNESSRLNALRDYSILDTLPEKEYDDITLLASYICDTPISLISLLDDKRQWFKSRHGLNVDSTPKDIAFCAHAINDQNNILIVQDSRKDDRFHDNPLVINEPHVVFYAGVPLISSDGYPLGTLCVIDNKPKELNLNQLDALKSLSNQVMKLFELRKISDSLRLHVKELENQNKGLTHFARIAAHDIKSPLNNIIMTAELIESEFLTNFDQEGKDLFRLIGNSSKKLTQLIDGILQYSQDSSLHSKNKEEINVNETVNEIISLFNSDENVKFEVNFKSNLKLFINKTALEQVLINLISNCVKYNDKELAIIKITFSENSEEIIVTISDNGPGIKEEDKDRIFELFETTSNKDKNGNCGIGIGLATVKSLVESFGGKVSVVSNLGKGSTFEFTIKK